VNVQSSPELEGKGMYARQRWVFSQDHASLRTPSRNCWADHQFQPMDSIWNKGLGHRI